MSCSRALGDEVSEYVAADIGGTVAEAPIKKRFHGTVQLDPDRWSLDASRIAEEIVEHFTSQVGIEVKITLEIEAESKKGIPDSTVRTINENCNTLGFSHFDSEND